MNETIVLNGEEVPLESRTLQDLMARQGYDPGRRGIAVARNGEVIPRSLWGETRLSGGDRLEIVEAVQGG